ncbi:hypothetical protein JF544_08385 [Halobacillus kuroshimensis]|uniref:Membrane protein YkvI n=1 Tax=Halobacillus kuroshimensis TaxID=302481 RepID=A0ABS3DV82_9BACI|nr:hypothetical protein [Halobacillus kuroshimensis]MBN8235267.1 hypothetical protein [Halobacillus kuroshimensis]
MSRIFKIASAFIGIIVGAGFASGQEVLLYFTSFGNMGTAGAVLATAFFAYMGMMLTRLGTRMKADSHKEAVHRVSGWRWLGWVVDAVIIFTLFGVGVVMIAGAGSIPSQQFGIPAITGVIFMCVIVTAALLLNVDKVVKIIGSITPFLILTVVVISIYSVMSMDKSFAVLEATALKQPSDFSYWFISAMNYVSFNIAVGASMALLMGGNETDEKTSALGGLFGGLGLGLMIVLSHLAIFSRVDSIAGYDMPLLALVDELSPVLGAFYSIVLFGMVFNTAVSMFFSFAARFTTLGTARHKKFVLMTIAAAFGLSFLGFTDLVSLFYPLIGNMGLFLIAALLVAPFRFRAEEKKNSKQAA